MAAALLAFPCGGVSGRSATPGGGRHLLVLRRSRLSFAGPARRRRPLLSAAELRPRCCSWARSSNLWMRRAGDASPLNEEERRENSAALPDPRTSPTCSPSEPQSASWMHGLWNRNVFRRKTTANPTASGSRVANFGRIVLIGILFLSLGFIPGGRLSRPALAAPTMSTAEVKSEAEQRGKARKGGRRVEKGRENVSETDRDLPEVSSKSEEELWRELSAADKSRLREYLRILQIEGEVLSKHVDQAVDDYCFTQDALNSFTDDIEQDKKEEILKEKANVLAQYRKGLMSLAATSRKILQRMKEIPAPRTAASEEDKRLKVEKIARDLEEMKAAFDEREVLPKAAKIEPETKSAEAMEISALARQIELEQALSRRLLILMEKLATRLFDPIEDDDSTLAANLQELEDLICDESRWQHEDERTRTVLPGNRDGTKPLSLKEQEEILIARDRVLDATWYDEKKGRWEMQTSAIVQAVQDKLVAQARVRQDRRAMYVTLKGSDQEYYVNTQLFNSEYKDVGGFQALYVKLVASGANTSVEVMSIPLSEWSTERILKFPFRIFGWLLEDFWNSSFVVSVRPWYFKSVMGAVEEVMIRFGFPVIQKVIPQKARVFLGFELPEGAEAAEPTDIIMWQQEAQKHVDARYAEGSGSPAWWISLPVRCYALGLPLFIVLRFVVGFLITPFRPQSLEMNDSEWKRRKQEELIKKFDLQPTRETIDPIKSVFDKMKRVKRPEVRLEDFAGLDMIKEEIVEIISFLRNPKLFREMGARAPRGVLISGESGTGKTTLALAIAAAARVPVIELQGSELEGGAWVGQGASNVRELFKTAREMAPLIIFMDDFDRFAGVRGATSDTRKQDHESLINQLLVELDGFETQEGVVLVATTSRPDAIDEALRRPGRMDRTIELPMPNRREREQILRQAAHKTMDAELVDYVDWATVAEKTAGLTPARLKYVPEGLEGSAVSFKIADEEELFFIFAWLAAVNKASPRWLKESKFTKKYNEMLIDWLGLRLTKQDMEDAVEYLDVFGESRPGIELFDPPYVWTREFKFPHAVWAVGKGLITLLLPDFDRVDMIWLDPFSYEGIGFTKATKKLDGGYRETGALTRSYCEKELVSYFGSFVASRMLLPFGENNTLSRFEMESAKEAATRMVVEYGWAPDDSPMIYMIQGSAGTLAMGDEHEMEVAKKINDVFYMACDKAFEMLEKNRPTLEAMLEHLVEFDVLSREDLANILAEKGAVSEESPFSIIPYSRAEVVGASTNGTGRSGKESPISVLG